MVQIRRVSILHQCYTETQGFTCFRVSLLSRHQYYIGIHGSDKVGCQYYINITLTQIDSNVTVSDVHLFGLVNRWGGGHFETLGYQWLIFVSKRFIIIMFCLSNKNDKTTWFCSARFANVYPDELVLTVRSVGWVPTLQDRTQSCNAVQSSFTRLVHVKRSQLVTRVYLFSVRFLRLTQLPVIRGESDFDNVSLRLQFNLLGNGQC